MIIIIIQFILLLLFFLFMAALSFLIITFPRWYLEIDEKKMVEKLVNKFGKLYGNLLVFLYLCHSLTITPFALILLSYKYFWSAELINNFSVWILITFIFEWIISFIPIANIYYILNNIEIMNLIK